MHVKLINYLVLSFKFFAILGEGVWARELRGAMEVCEFRREFRDGPVLQDALEVRFPGRTRLSHLPDTVVEGPGRDISPLVDDCALEKCIRVHDICYIKKHNQAENDTRRADICFSNSAMAKVHIFIIDRVLMSQHCRFRRYLHFHEIVRIW